MTRCALPSERWIERGLTSLTWQVTPRMSLMSRVMRLVSCSSSLISSENNVLADLYLDAHGIHGALPLDDDLVMGLDALDAHQHMLHLGRKDIDAPDDQHVVGTAGHLVHAHQGAAAVAGLGNASVEISLVR